MGSTATRLTSAENSRLSLSLTQRKRHGRAVNAVGEFLRNRLRVPEVYLNPNGFRYIDVLAVDAAGSGDLHAAEVRVDAVRTPTTQVLEQVQSLKKLPMHFKYLVIPAHPSVARLVSSSALFASDGIGRVGILKLIEDGENAPSIELVVAPERFRVKPEDMTKIERLLHKLSPDIFVRV